MLKLYQKGFFYYISGIILLTLGISLTIQSHLGTSPFDALLVGLYRTFGLSIGSWEIVVGFSIIVLNALFTQSKPEYFAMLTSLLTGIGIDTWLYVQGTWLTTNSIFEQSVLLLLGIIFTGIGVAIYLESSFAPNPMDRSMVILTDKTGWSFSKSRAIISITLVIVAFFFNGAIGIGTLLNALFSGIIIQRIRPYVLSFKHRNYTKKVKVS
ncbi:YczE/YyaS/YitT family protein [Gracilibacillus kekensis]|uniref:YitT family protein n=1 Tax=Gracilibacillus kekensis TaxID=1027249 RepID=A0A1M7MRX8_9BACI|nr:hypothetical protein [Gracilibacillus kekensis]SHM93834.1 hypothetical protein SAMN05216179_1337 [Gracilibacillus kekensis]